MQDETLIPDERGQPTPRDTLGWLQIVLSIAAIGISILCTVLAWPKPLK